MARNKVLHTRDAGTVVEQTLCTVATGADSPKVRASKKKATTEVMKRYNHKTSCKKLEMILACNFNPGDYVIMLSFLNQYYPCSKSIVVSRCKQFRAKMAKYYARKGKKFFAVWCIEQQHGDGRIHIHMVIPKASQHDYAAILAAWTWGGVDIKPLRVDRDKNYSSLAWYMAKEGPEKNSQRAWSYTRNIRKPIEDTQRVDSGYCLQAPKGVHVIERYDVETAFGTFQYLKYYIPPNATHKSQLRKIK